MHATGAANRVAAPKSENQDFGFERCNNTLTFNRGRDTFRKLSAENSGEKS
jgi:hypothetical protein